MSKDKLILFIWSIVTGLLIIFGFIGIISKLTYDPVKRVSSIFSYSGVYYNNDDKISLYLTYDNKVELVAAVNSTYTLLTFEFDNDRLKYTSFSNGEELYINKVGNVIEITSNKSNIEHSAILGKYTLNNFDSLGWSSIYKCGKTELVIDEYDKNNIMVSINYENSSLMKPVDVISQDSLIINNENLGVVEKIKIVRNRSKIDFKSSSTEKDSLLNKINNNCKRVK